MSVAATTVLPVTSIDSVYLQVWAQLTESSAPDGDAFDLASSIFTSDEFLSRWLSEEQENYTKDPKLVLQRQCVALLRCFKLHQHRTALQNEVFGHQSLKMMFVGVNQIVESYRNELVQFQQKRFGMSHIPKLIELRQKIHETFMIPRSHSSPGDIIACLVEKLSQSSLCSDSVRTHLLSFLDLEAYVVETARNQAEAVINAPNPTSLKKLLLLPATATAQQVMSAYNTFIHLLSNCDTYVDPELVGKALSILRESFASWERNRIEAEKKRQEAEEEQRKKREVDDRAKKEQQDKIRAAIKFLLQVDRTSNLPKDPYDSKATNPFYYLGFNPHAVPEGMELKSVIKECRKLLPRLTHPDKLRTDDEDERQDANEAFRLAGEAVKKALRLADTPQYLRRDMPGLVCAPWLGTLGLPEHGASGKPKAKSKARGKKRAREA